MNSIIKTAIFSFIFAISASLFGQEPTIIIEPVNETIYDISITIPVKENDAVYEDYLDVSIDTPHITLTGWKTSIEPNAMYDTTFKETKRLFTQTVTLSLQAINYGKPLDATIHLNYYPRSQKKIVHHMFPVSFAYSESKFEEVDHLQVENNYHSAKKSQPQSWTGYFSALLASSDSLWAQFALALLLGLFLSLTPCIYPMIPITMGILQAQGSQSMRRNFLLALSYTLGIATTFAVLGTAAAFTGTMVGSLLQKPIVVLSIAGLLLYLAGSMLGLYEMYVPKALQPKHNATGGGSCASAFLFGAASGSVASPCLSPGLLLLLTIVSSLGSVFLGFLLLFAFGLGLGMPLLLIGTFSSSLKVLPKAGAWMVEVKQFFGWVLVGTSFYFLSILMPAYAIAWLTALAVCTAGIFYAQKSITTRDHLTYKKFMGTTCIAVSVLLSFQAFKITMMHQNDLAHPLWMNDYTQAIAQAKKEHKKLFLDISGPFCSICRAIDKKILSNDQVQEEIQKFVPIKIENLEENETTLALQKKFNIMGVPALLVIDPENETMVSQWGGELYDSTPEAFSAELKQYCEA